MKICLNITAVRLMTSFFAWAIVFFALRFVDDGRKQHEENRQEVSNLLTLILNRRISPAVSMDGYFIASINKFVKSRRSRRFDQFLHDR